MSDHLKHWIGAALLVFTAVFLGIGCLPAEQPDEITYYSRGESDFSTASLPRLSPADLTNMGSAEELEGLPGVGPATAEAILHERQENGLFVYPEDLMAVKGIGEKKLGQIRPMLTFLSDESEE